MSRQLVDFALSGQLQYEVNPDSHPISLNFTKECTYERKRRYQ